MTNSLVPVTNSLVPVTGTNVIKLPPLYDVPLLPGNIANTGMLEEHRSVNYIVTSEGVVLPIDQDLNLVSTTVSTDNGGEYLQIHTQHSHNNLANPHTHKPQININPATGRVSSKRISYETTEQDINEADQSLKNGTMRRRTGRKDKGGIK